MFYQICAAKSISHNSFLDLRVVSNSETESIVKQRLREMWQKKIGRMGWMYYGVQRKWEKGVGILPLIIQY